MECFETPTSHTLNFGVMDGVLYYPGGFICPSVFGYLLRGTGLWLSCRMLMVLVSSVSLLNMRARLELLDARAPRIQLNYSYGN